MPNLRTGVKPTWSPPTPQSMRHTLAGFATGVAVIAARVDGRTVGIVANSLSSVSLDPPLVSVAFDRSSTTWPLLRHASRWGVSILGEDHASIVAALSRPSGERFDGLDLRIGDDGSVHLNGSAAGLTVTRHAEIDAGDHVLALLRAVDLYRDADQRPLVFYSSDLHRLAG